MNNSSTKVDTVDNLSAAVEQILNFTTHSTRFDLKKSHLLMFHLIVDINLFILSFFRLLQWQHYSAHVAVTVRHTSCPSLPSETNCPCPVKHTGCSCPERHTSYPCPLRHTQTVLGQRGTQIVFVQWSTQAVLAQWGTRTVLGQLGTLAVLGQRGTQAVMVFSHWILCPVSLQQDSKHSASLMYFITQGSVACSLSLS